MSCRLAFRSFRFRFRATCSRTDPGIDNADVDAALREDDLRSFERKTPDRVGKGRYRRVETGDSSVDDRAGAIDARKKCGGEVGAGGGEAAPGGLKNGVARPERHPDPATATGVTFLDIPDPGWKGVAGGNLRTVSRDQHRADLTNPVRTPGGGAKRRRHVGARRRIKFVQVSVLVILPPSPGSDFVLATARSWYAFAATVSEQRELCASFTFGARRDTNEV